MIVSGWNCCQKMPAHSPWLLGTCWDALLLEVVSKWKLWPGQMSQASCSWEVKLCTAGVHSFIQQIITTCLKRAGPSPGCWAGAHCDKTGMATGELGQGACTHTACSPHSVWTLPQPCTSALGVEQLESDYRCPHLQSHRPPCS